MGNQTQQQNQNINTTSPGEKDGDRERKSFPIYDLTSEGFKLIEKLLPEWENTSGDEMRYGYRIEEGDKSWRLSFDPQLKRVEFSEAKPTMMSPRIGMRNVEKVEIDEQTGYTEYLVPPRVPSRFNEPLLTNSDK